MWRPPSPWRVPARLLSWIIAAILWTLQYPLGRKVNERADAFAYLQGYEKDDLLPADAKQPESTVELLGYKASRNVVFTFSLTFAITAICWELGKPWQSKLLNTSPPTRCSPPAPPLSSLRRWSGSSPKPCGGS